MPINGEKEEEGEVALEGGKFSSLSRPKSLLSRGLNLVPRVLAKLKMADAGYLRDVEYQRNRIVFYGY